MFVTATCERCHEMIPLGEEHTDPDGGEGEFHEGCLEEELTERKAGK